MKKFLIVYHEYEYDCVFIEAVNLEECIKKFNETVKPIIDITLHEVCEVSKEYDYEEFDSICDEILRLEREEKEKKEKKEEEKREKLEYERLKKKFGD